MSDEPREKAIHFVSDTCNGEKCFCGEDATHKVGEEISVSDPSFGYRHNFTQYVCCQCFVNIVGNAAFCGLTRNGNDWTYCEDALPSDVKSGYYFATRKTNSGRTYTWQTHFSQELQSWSVISDETVIAWQPLPAPAEPKEEK